MKYSIKTLLLTTAAIAVAVWFMRSAYIGFTRIENGENVATVDWLPDAAANISYYRSYAHTAYEFDITEAAFRSWSRWAVEELDEPVRIERYSRFSKRLLDPPPNATDEELQAHAMAYSEQSAIIEDGLYYAYTQNNGGGVWVAYDRKYGRAYFRSSAR